MAKKVSADAVVKDIRRSLAATVGHRPPATPIEFWCQGEVCLKNRNQTALAKHALARRETRDQFGNGSTAARSRLKVTPIPRSSMSKSSGGTARGPRLR